MSEETEDREAIEVIKGLLRWADTYEDHMVSEDFKKRDAAVERAHRYLLDRGEEG